MDSELDELEERIELKFPPLYRQFLKYLHFYDLTEVGVRFEVHPIDKWKTVLIELYEAYEPDRIIGSGLIPFGAEAEMDAGVVCFDTRQRFDCGDCPVVF